MPHWMIIVTLKECSEQTQRGRAQCSTALVENLCIVSACQCIPAYLDQIRTYLYWMITHLLQQCLSNFVSHSQNCANVCQHHVCNFVEASDALIHHSFFVIVRCFESLSNLLKINSNIWFFLHDFIFFRQFVTFFYYDERLLQSWESLFHCSFLLV